MAVDNSYTTNFGKVFIGHTGQGLRVSSAHITAAGIRGPATAAGKGRTGGEHTMQ